jgi:hypothetical protein
MPSWVAHVAQFTQYVCCCWGRRSDRSRHCRRCRRCCCCPRSCHRPCPCSLLSSPLCLLLCWVSAAEHPTGPYTAATAGGCSSAAPAAGSAAGNMRGKTARYSTCCYVMLWHTCTVTATARGCSSAAGAAESTAGHMRGNIAHGFV